MIIQGAETNADKRVRFTRSKVPDEVEEAGYLRLFGTAGCHVCGAWPAIPSTHARVK